MCQYDGAGIWGIDGCCGRCWDVFSGARGGKAGVGGKTGGEVDGDEDGDDEEDDEELRSTRAVHIP